jgi:hypothetical protein
MIDYSDDLVDFEQNYVAPLSNNPSNTNETEEKIRETKEELRRNTNLLFLYYTRYVMNGAYVNRIT